MSEIIPDTRDWTDVLAGGCSECGFTGTEDPTVVPRHPRRGGRYLADGSDQG